MSPWRTHLFSDVETSTLPFKSRCLRDVTMRLATTDERLVVWGEPL
ncbi:MAG TPA: hypothetical protein VMT70_21635 [Vicinamibacteria bacterium]|nr:hypothetical protein [Vicinamibacteria bacterium]